MATSSDQKKGASSELWRAHQERAAFAFLPFVAELFGRGSLPLRKAEPVPVRRDEALTLEVVEALELLLRRGVLAFLCREGGWRAQSWAAPGRDQPRRRVRLIDPALWRGRGRKLRFGPASVDALLITFNALCEITGGRVDRGHRLDRAAFPRQLHADFERNGDVLVHHITWAKIRQTPLKIDEATWSYLSQNPWTRLARLDARAGGGLPEADRVARTLDRLLAPDLAPELYWLRGSVVECWRRELRTRWDSLDRFHRLNEGMAHYFEAIVQRARQHERRDWLLLLVDFFRAHLAREEALEERAEEFNRLARSLRFAERETYRRTWARAVQIGAELQDEYLRARAIPYIDREAPDLIFMEAMEAAPFDEIAGRARVLANQLNDVIS